eukprot:PLAT11322.2.p3 GENE.PLAT11322.2~~PLAT11322.2.p3  ORF type:complete len:103 (-),score=47.99 PLAT11322.2:27-335(-)
MTPLMLAAMLGNDAVAATLLAAGADVNAATDDDFATALCVAVCGAHADVVSLLLSNGAVVSTVLADGSTLLATASEVDGMALPAALCAAGAAVDACWPPQRL